MNRKNLSIILFSLIFAVMAALTGCGGSVGSDPLPTAIISEEKTVWQNNLPQIIQAIENDPNADWVAGETWVTRTFSTPEAAQVLLGLMTGGFPDYRFNQSLKDTIENPTGQEQQKPLMSIRPSRFSWLEKDGKNWMTSVKQQGQYGTCVAFACCGAFEAALKIGNNSPDSDYDLSEWYLWYKMTDKRPPSPGGWWIHRASEYLVNNGTVFESVTPYSLVSMYPAFQEPVASAEFTRLQSWKWANNSDEIKEALLSGPVVGGMTVYEDFFNYAGGIYRKVYGASMGGHAIIILGYDDNGQYWICKNSWSDQWGEQGYFRIAYGNIENYALAYKPAIIDRGLPQIIEFSPAENAANVSVQTKIAIRFNETVASATLNSSTFSVASGAVLIPGSISFSSDAKTATFTPTMALPYSSLISITVSTGVKDLAGNAMAANKTWSFSTAAASDLTAPTIISVVPVENALNVATNSLVTVSFSEAMATATINTGTFTLASGATAIAGRITCSADGRTATFTPTLPLPYGALISVMITTGIKDPSGNTLTSGKIWSFKTENSPDSVPPTILSVIPAENATEISANTQISVKFSEAMATDTVYTGTFTLASGSNVIAGSVTISNDGRTATFTPLLPLPYASLISATITNGVKDRYGNAMAANKTWSFTTATAPDITAPTVISVVPAENALNIATSTLITAYFSEAMATDTVYTGTFTLASGSNIIAGSVTISNDGRTATFTPLLPLPYASLISATITNGVKDRAGNAMAVNKTWSFTTAAAPDITAPTVISVIPAENALNIATTTLITVYFSEAMATTTINTGSFTLASGATAIAGNISCSNDGRTATFTPTLALPYASLISATINNGVKDLAGNTMAANKTWSFTTAAAPDITAPTVISVVPAENALNIATATLITVYFSEAMATTTINTGSFTLASGATAIAGSISCSNDGRIATFTPTLALPYASLISATINNGVKDRAGNAMAVNKTWSFTTAAAPDITAPTVISVVPAENALNIATGTLITVYFSEAMATTTINTGSFTLASGATAIAGSISCSNDGRTATFTPLLPLPYASLISATVTNGVKDLAGNAMAANKTWSFTTAATPDITAPTVISVVPAENALNIATATLITVYFSEAMATTTINTGSFTLASGATAIAGNISCSGDGRTATFTPAFGLPPGSIITATLAGTTKDTAGNSLGSDKVWNFTTVKDSISPFVIGTIPADGTRHLASGTHFQIIFSEPMNSGTITAANIAIASGTDILSGSFSLSADLCIATFVPDLPLPYATLTVTISSGCQDISGNPLTPEIIATITVAPHIISICGGLNHSVFLAENGLVWTCGSHDMAQIGDGNMIAYNRKRPVPTLMTDCIAIAAGAYYTLAIKSDNTLWGWGHHQSAELGIATGPYEAYFGIPFPVQIASLTAPVIDIACGHDHSFAITSDGVLWAWGKNENGELGLGDYETRWFPASVPGLINVIDVAAEEEGSIALLQDGTVWFWGGPGDIATPTQVTGLTGTIKTVNPGSTWGGSNAAYNLLKTDGNVTVKNIYTGGPEDIGDPITGITEVFSVYTPFGGHCMFRNNQGKIFARGTNMDGQLGLGHNAEVWAEEVTSMAGATLIGVGGATTFFGKSDGTIWSCGDNGMGQLGNGTTTETNIPVMIDFP